ncbi:MAG TPA: ABC transporter permease [Hyphomicrobiaceae bacterium]|nr:ABC transporter permease [Hyphomicrobiaceae bacterium]
MPTWQDAERSDAAASSAAPARGAGVLRARGDQLIVLVALVAIWAVLSEVLGTYWIGSPWGVALRLGDGLISGDLLTHASYTLMEAVAGFLIGAIPAAALPFALRRFPLVTAILDPFMVGGYGAPKLALAPLFILWFGIGVESKIALVAITVFFTVYFSALAGIRALDARLVQMAQVMGASERAVARHIVFPGAVPYIFTGFRIAMPYSIGGAVIAELISANRGLGYLIQLSAMNFDTIGLFVAVVATSVIVFLCNGSVDIVERWLLRWRPPADAKAELGS